MTNSQNHKIVLSILAQSIHAFLGISCDILTLKGEDQKEHRLLKYLKWCRDLLFTTIVASYTLDMPPLIYFRIFGHATTLTMHSVNSLVMLSSLQDEIITRDPEIKILASMQSRFLTIWNIMFQLIYFGLAITCDVLTLMNKDHLLPKPVKKFRDFFFTSVVFPGTLLVFIIFWPLYLYDRNIIFPEFIDKVFSQKSNYVMHIAIVPAVLWELAFQPRNKPKSHVLNLGVLFCYYSAYNIFIHYTYNERGLWPYPLMGMLYGTVYYIILHAYIFIMTIFSYYAQWPLHSFFWGKENRTWEKRKVK